MTYDSAEKSVEDAEPREYFTLSLNDGVTVYRHTTGSRDLVVAGVTYTAIAAARGEIAITMPGEEKDLTLTLPIDHPLARRFPQQSQPPSKITFTLYRQIGGETRQAWVGDVAAMSAENRTAKFRIPSRAGEWMMKSVPSTAATELCQHMLYGSRCGVSRTGFAPSGIGHKQTVTVTAIDGVTITVDLAGVTAADTFRRTWAENGEVFHSVTGERMTVRIQADLTPGVGTVTKLTLAGPIVGLAIGHSVDVYAGCDWFLETSCEGKFNNRQNYGGLPLLPTKNPFVATGSGLRGNT